MSVVTTLQKNRAKGIEQETLTLISETFRRTFAGLTFADQLDRQRGHSTFKIAISHRAYGKYFFVRIQKVFRLTFKMPLPDFPSLHFPSSSG